MENKHIERIKYALTQVEYTLDDPELESYMLLKLRKAYEEAGVEMPPKIKAFYVKEVQRIHKELSKKLERLRNKDNPEN